MKDIEDLVVHVKVSSIPSDSAVQSLRNGEAKSALAVTWSDNSVKPYNVISYKENGHDKLISWEEKNYSSMEKLLEDNLGKLRADDEPASQLHVSAATYAKLTDFEKKESVTLQVGNINYKMNFNMNDLTRSIAIKVLDQNEEDKFKDQGIEYLYDLAEKSAKEKHTTVNALHIDDKLQWRMKSYDENGELLFEPDIKREAFYNQMQLGTVIMLQRTYDKLTNPEKALADGGPGQYHLKDGPIKYLLTFLS